MHTCAVALALCSSGCASEPYWVRIAEPWQVKEIRIHRLDVSPWPVDGWAVRNKDGSCDIFITRRAQNQECVEAHERKHCEGLDHPKYPYNLACTFRPLGRLH